MAVLKHRNVTITLPGEVTPGRGRRKPIQPKSHHLVADGGFYARPEGRGCEGSSLSGLLLRCEVFPVVHIVGLGYNRPGQARGPVAVSGGEKLSGAGFKRNVVIPQVVQVKLSTVVWFRCLFKQPIWSCRAIVRRGDVMAVTSLQRDFAVSKIMQI